VASSQPCKTIIASLRRHCGTLAQPRISILGPTSVQWPRAKLPPPRFQQTVTVAVFALRILLAPGFVVLASLAARRFGARIGGVVAGLPVIAGPILLVLALQHGSTFASRAAVGVLLGMVGLAAFVLAYVAIARWRSWPSAIVAAYAAFVLAVVVMRPVSVGAFAALMIACGSLVLTLGLLPRPPRVGGTRAASTRWDMPFRAVCTAVAVVSVTAIATTLGPHLSGLVTTFPIITAVLSVFTHAHRGRDEAIRLLRGFTVGFFSYAAFCFIVAMTIRPLGVGGCFALATLLALCVQAIGVIASQQRFVRRQQVAQPQAEGGALDYT
jgi:hypothetical protein